MTSKGIQKRTASQKRTLSKANIIKLETAIASSPNLIRFNPLTAFKTPTVSFQKDVPQNLSQGDAEDKGKARWGQSSRTQDLTSEEHDDRLWVDIYQPTTEAELAVHKKKVDDVRRWLHESFEGGPSGKLTKYRRLLALTGPAGTGKTTTVRVLAREMGFDIMEWGNSVSGSSSSIFDGPSNPDQRLLSDYPLDNEALFSKFEAFLSRASSYQNILTTSASTLQGSSTNSSACFPKRQIILLEDLPNILHSDTQARFHAALQLLVTSPVSSPPVPVVIIISDPGLRGEASDERLASGVWAKGKDGVVDVRTAIPRDLLTGPYVTQIGFNPIAPTLLTKALQTLLNAHYSVSSQASPPREIVDAVVETSNGDIRSAIMALQFACIIQMSGKARKKKIKDKRISVVLEFVTRREQSLVLFHLMGKVLYNKRKGDPPSASATAKDIHREKMIDAQLRDHPKLPPDLEEHERRASRINVDMLYTDSPIDSSLFSLYIHQNYPQFCDDVEQCEGVADWLSWVDSSGGEAWYQGNPHRFHLLALGTLHSLPSPVTRRSQKIFKPAFFDYLQKEKNAWEGVGDARGWTLGEGTSQGLQVGSWTRGIVAVELGGVLKARDADTSGRSRLSRPPVSHRLFSHLRFTSSESPGDGRPLGESEANSHEEEDEEDYAGQVLIEKKDTGGWLEDDDIEEF